jgi:hypothetical protein
MTHLLWYCGNGHSMCLNCGEVVEQKPTALDDDE